MSLESALRTAIQIVTALEEAHRRQILHRDLKPSNILISGGEVKLVDFGLAKLSATASGVEPQGDCETQTAEGFILGNPAYMSPEQAHGKSLDERSDVFSFGAVLYEMLSGKPAFSGTSVLDTLRAVVSENPAYIELPLSHIVTKCLAKEAADRYQDVTQVRRALVQIGEAETCSQPGGVDRRVAVREFWRGQGERVLQ